MSGGSSLFYVAILASGRVAGDIKATLTEGFHWGEALAIYVIARDTLRTRRDWAGLVACFFVGASGEAFIGTVQSKLGLGNLSFFVGGIARSFGTFGRPNSYAGYLEMIVPFAVTVSLWALFASRRRCGDGTRCAAGRSRGAARAPATARAARRRSRARARRR